VEKKKHQKRWKRTDCRIKKIKPVTMKKKKQKRRPERKEIEKKRRGGEIERKDLQGLPLNWAKEG